MVAGSVYQAFWNALSDRPVAEGVKDYDLFYFDDDLSYEAEDVVIQRARALFADLDVLKISKQWLSAAVFVDGSPVWTTTLRGEEASSGNPFAAELSKEKAQLEDHILPGARSELEPGAVEALGEVAALEIVVVREIASGFLGTALDVVDAHRFQRAEAA